MNLPDTGLDPGVIRVQGMIDVAIVELKEGLRERSRTSQFTYHALVTAFLREDLGEFFFQLFVVQDAFQMIGGRSALVVFLHLCPPVLEQLLRKDLTGDGVLDDLQLIIVASFATVESLR